MGWVNSFLRLVPQKVKIAARAIHPPTPSFKGGGFRRHTGYVAGKGTSIRIEALQPEHIPAILEIEKLCNSAPWSERSFRGELDNPQSVFLVALASASRRETGQGSPEPSPPAPSPFSRRDKGEGEVVAYAGLWVVVDEGHITTVAVDPDHRRQGIGKRLIQELLKRGEAKGVECATLEVRASNEGAIQMYEQLGFKQAATRRNYYPDNREDAVIMWKDAV